MPLMLPVLFPADETNAKKGHISLTGAGLSLTPSLDENGKPVLTLAPAMSSATPSAPGTPSAGAATTPARADHVHAVPTPAQVGSPSTSRAVASGKGLAGGGDLSADRTLTIASFGGFLAKDWDPASTLYVKNTFTALKTYDVGDGGMFILHGLYLPPTVNPNIKTRLLVIFHDQSSVFIENGSTTNPLTDNAQGLGNFIMGDAANNQAAKNDGKAIRKLVFEVKNADSQNDITVDLAAFRVRAYCVPIGGGSVTTT